ncbi:MAG: DNA translocase FtsK 4TM domain-containing protein [Alphaproteobacteria bacterium]|nr:DNA translocase FtsK 4TM domain-containing protein [Alphaproteobacteria bacterium]
MGIFKGKKKRKTLVKSKRKRQPLLPVALQGFLARRLTDIVAIACLSSASALALSLASHDPKDPSLNTVAAADQVHNLLGAPGAWSADMLLQSLGLAAWVFPVTLGVWGYRILRRRPLYGFGGKVPMLLFSVLFAAIALARIPATDGLGLTGAYMGGFTGSMILNALGAALQGWIGAMSYTFVALSAAFLAVVTGLMAQGVSIDGWIEGLTRTGHMIALSLRKMAHAASTFLSWHQKYSHGGTEEAATPRKRRVSLQNDAAPEPKAESASPAMPQIIPRKKPIVTQRTETKATPAPRQKNLDLGSDGDFSVPPLDLLNDIPTGAHIRLDETALEKNAELLHNTLNDFGVQGEILKVSPGPIVTLYEMEPAPGTKTSRVVGLSDDIARSMSAVSVRVAVVPGKNAIGIELPNAKRETVFLKELISTQDYEKTGARLPLVLGKNIAGNPVIADLAKMPHLLVAGTTGSGKSVAVNTMILSLLYRLTPEQCRFIMIDPKMLELSVYDDIPHLLTPVVTEPHRAVTALKWAVREMEDRYRAMSKLGVRNIDGFNQRVTEARDKGEVLTHRVQTGFDADTGKPVYEEQPIPLANLPYIVIIVDEFADLMLAAGKEVENAIQRLAQMARAAGIHLIMATQRPSVDVITGVIKANFPTRISFQVTSRIDSRTILGDSGAEQLLGQGDMLYMAAGGRITRVHGPFVSDDEVEKVVACLQSQGAPVYVDGVTEDDGDNGFGNIDAGDSGDALYDQAVAIVLRERKVSTSYIQRCLQIGYNRAARIVERMEQEGLISAANHVGKREILVDNYGT